MKSIKNSKVYKILSIAGSDSSAGAGIQADIKTVKSLGGYCLTAVSMITSQNTKEVTDTYNIPTETVMNQIRTISEDFDYNAIKIGIIPTVNLAKELYSFFKNKKLPIVVDPVYKSTSGKKFIKKKDFIKIQKILNKISTIVLPNIEEAEILANMKISTLEDLKVASRTITQSNKNSILIKGLICRNKSIMDLLYENKSFYKFRYKKIYKREIHGTGCTLSSALAFYLARGLGVKPSIKFSKKYLSKITKKPLEFVLDNNPMKH